MFRSCQFQTSLVLLLALSSGCHWLDPYLDHPPLRDAPREHAQADAAPGRNVDAEDDTPQPDVSAADQAADLSPDAAPLCSSTGVPTDCNPIELSGCVVGTCYLIRDRGPSCVCDPGTVGVGGACSTTVDCTPGLACAGMQPPGTCRQVCVPGPFGGCPPMFICRTIWGLEDYGYCDSWW